MNQGKIRDARVYMLEGRYDDAHALLRSVGSLEAQDLLQIIDHVKKQGFKQKTWDIESNPAVFSLWQRYVVEDRRLALLFAAVVLPTGGLWAIAGFGPVTFSGNIFSLAEILLLVITVMILGAFIPYLVRKPIPPTSTQLIRARPGLLRGVGCGLAAGAGVAVAETLTSGVQSAGLMLFLLWISFCLLGGYYFLRKADVIEDLQNKLFETRFLIDSSTTSQEEM